LQLLEIQAKIMQEIAIANRIESASEVEIEEYYGNSGEGTLGASSKDSTVSLGISGSKQNVSKRIYRFISSEGLKEEIEQENKED
jgi:hypothetical protein